MGDRENSYGSWCLVAGAAEGLGEAWSTALAEKGMDLIMVDHQDGPMHALGDRLERDFGVRTRRLEMELGEEGSVTIMMDAVKETACRFLVYNAAYSRVKKFTENGPGDLDRYVEVNVRTPMQLVHAFVHHHAGNPGQKKGIVLMASLAGLWGTRFLAPYGATKAFNQVLAEALYHELKPENFNVIACVAGATATPAYLGTNPRYGRIRPHVMNPRQVVEETLHSLGRKALCIPGFRNRMNYFLMTRILSRKNTARLFNRVVGSMYTDI
jgi:short-subunit dehydrogenase